MKYKVGDRVRATKNFGKAKVGYFGTVINAYESVTGSHHFCVEFDAFVDGHNGNGVNGAKGKDGHCWWFCTDQDVFVVVERAKIVITSDGTETLARLYEGNKVIKTATAKCSPADTFDFKTGAEIAFNRLMGVKEVKDEKLFKFEVGKQYIGSNRNGSLVIEITSAKHHAEGLNAINRYEYKVVMGEDNGILKFDEECPFSKRLKPYDPPYYNGKAVCIETKPHWAYTVGKVYEFKDGTTVIDNGFRVYTSQPVKSINEWNELHGHFAKMLEIVE